MYESIYKSSLFKDKVIIVTGGGSGIGRCTAHELAALGAHVIILGRTLEKLEKVAEEISSSGQLCDVYSLDIRESIAIKKVVTNIIENTGPFMAW